MSFKATQLVHPLASLLAAYEPKHHFFGETFENELRCRGRLLTVARKMAGEDEDFAELMDDLQRPGAKAPEAAASPLAMAECVAHTVVTMADPDQRDDGIWKDEFRLYLEGFKGDPGAVRTSLDRLFEKAIRETMDPSVSFERTTRL